MIIPLYNIEDVVNTYYDSDINAVIVEWKVLTTNEHFRGSCTAQLDAMEKYSSSLLIIDAGKTNGIPYPEDQEWLITTLYPRIRSLGKHLIINIIPENQISKLGVKTWIQSGEKNEIHFMEVANMEKAYEVAKANLDHADRII